MGKTKYGPLTERARCRLCRETSEDVDYKNLDLLEKYVARNGKIVSRRRTGTCARHQRLLKSAIKHARFMGFMPYQSS